MYVTCTVQAKGTRLAKPVLSLGLMCLAFITGLNRVAEYRNHWSDVIAGFIIGTAIATFLVRLTPTKVLCGAVSVKDRGTEGCGVCDGRHSDIQCITCTMHTYRHRSRKFSIGDGDLLYLKSLAFFLITVTGS